MVFLGWTSFLREVTVHVAHIQFSSIERELDLLSRRHEFTHVPCIDSRNWLKITKIPRISFGLRTFAQIDGPDSDPIANCAHAPAGHACSHACTGAWVGWDIDMDAAGAVSGILVALHYSRCVVRACTGMPTLLCVIKRGRSPVPSR